RYSDRVRQSSLAEKRCPTARCAQRHIGSFRLSCMLARSERSPTLNPVRSRSRVLADAVPSALLCASPTKPCAFTAPHSAAYIDWSACRLHCNARRPESLNFLILAPREHRASKARRHKLGVLRSQKPACIEPANCIMQSIGTKRYGKVKGNEREKVNKEAKKVMHERKVGACFPDSHDRRVGGCNLRPQFNFNSSPSAAVLDRCSRKCRLETPDHGEAFAVGWRPSQK
ncbi:hypothetical protein MAPG_04206, partial [Magnaporthiopsis poae ATCC 64411]|uniref:Uncharacterized protein n=1 Tax=Magnaporthiopsis poae (strain ATCC 64411 / 73-15) TaxID=644358 RepID=A0A0C4DW35_MAGP6